jgi:hypothetical protein
MQTVFTEQDLWMVQVQLWQVQARECIFNRIDWHGNYPMIIMVL